ncbi:MAG: hypothetical protein WD906_03505 [Anaerolineales bacterium]
MIYPKARPGLSFARLSSVRPLHGTPLPAVAEDILVPYFWGWSLEGERMEGLDEAGRWIDGGQTEADLLLLGRDNLILVEAKRFSGFGRCARYLAERCPEINRYEAGVTSEHLGTEARAADAERGQLDAECRYWSEPAARFDTQLDFGPRPDPASSAPPCSRHYQLARLLLLGSTLAAGIGRTFHLWGVVPRSEWQRLRPDWEDFVERLRDESMWKRQRVIAWEDWVRL